MILKIFRVEWRGRLLVGLLGLAVCAVAAVVFGVAGLFGSDAFAARMAEIGFGFFNGVSYAVPLLFVAQSVVIGFYKYYRLAGVREKQFLAGELFSVFVWTAMFLAAEMLAATAFDSICFIGRDAIRAQVGRSSFLLSLREHGAPRLLFAPSVGLSAALLLFIFDAARVTARRLRSAAGKIFAVFLFLLLCALVQVSVQYIAYLSARYVDLSLLAVPGGVLPVWPMFWEDTVKDAHWLAASWLNLVYLACEAAFCMFIYGYTAVLGRWKNELASE